MRTRSLIVKIAYGAAVVLILSGCSARNIHKDTSYKKQLTEVSVAVQPVLFQPNGTSNMYLSFNKEALFVLQYAPAALTRELEANGVKVVPMAKTAEPALIIRPKNGRRTCQNGNCFDEVWYFVYLYEKNDKKTVWSGEFNVLGSPSLYDKARQEESMSHFARHITQAMKDSRLLPK